MIHFGDMRVFEKSRSAVVSAGIYVDERLDTLLSITGRMDGFLYRCRNDPSYTMLYVSDGIQTVSGYPPEDFIGNRVRDFSSAIHPDDLPSVYAAVDQALKERRNWNMDYRMIRRKGDPVWVREIGGGVFTDRGELEFLEGFVVDISDRKGIEDLNIKLLKELKQNNDELSTQKRELELAKQQSDHSANHDLLTGLPNRRAFQERLKEMVDTNSRTDAATGLLFIDLDKFKDVNDTLGHDAGDTVLRQVAKQLRAILRSGDFVARLGGDEFAFLLTADPSQLHDKAGRVAERILDNLHLKVAAPGYEIHVGCTVGVALCPKDARDAQELIAVADRLMYVGKKNGRHRLVTAADLDTQARARRESSPGDAPPFAAVDPDTLIFHAIAN